MASQEVAIVLPRGTEVVSVFGPADRNVKMLREALGVRVTARGSSIRVAGEPEPVAAARRAIERLIAAAADGSEGKKYAKRMDVLNLISEAMADAVEDREQIGMISTDGWQVAEPGTKPWGAQLSVYVAGRPVKPMTPNQQAYLDAIRDHDVVFGIGPAGTGKTYLAVAAAVHLLKVGRARKVILARPAVEAGEKLGFLPGDLQQKVNPYLRPLLDALHDMMDFNTLKRFMASDVIEIVPLAYMRGRTLNRSVIILDEAQNTTRGQMKMFLTRMGEGSKVIVNGDMTQIDIAEPEQSGLIDAVRTLGRVAGVGMVTLDQSDIVRHEMVQRIVDAYEKSENTKAKWPKSGTGSQSSAGGVSMKNGER